MTQPPDSAVPNHVHDHTTHHHPELLELGVIRERGDALRADIAEIKGMLQMSFVTKAEFKPVQLIAYGLVAIVGVRVIIGLIALLKLS